MFTGSWKHTDRKHVDGTHVSRCWTSAGQNHGQSFSKLAAFSAFNKQILHRKTMGKISEYAQIILG